MTSYCGTPPVPIEIWSRWNFDPFLLGGLALWLVAVRAADRPRLALMAWGVLAVLFVSPLCALSVSLFSARTLHHLILVGAAAPLLALAFPRGPRLGAVLPLVLFAATLWAWHLPALYEASQAGTASYWAMQASLLATATLFWQGALRQPPIPAIATLVAATAQMGLLGAVLTFAREPLYPWHESTTLAWGMTQLADQQLGGLVMWAPGMLPFAACVLWVAARIKRQGLASA
ncbi:MAG: hypothetical protein DI629_07740 [Mesorhizobium amorphae]|nr:MAG: hypothetical protein DI629_07740 [Mesorhizobium amorphae]